MYNWVVQDAIVAFVDSLKPQFGAQADLYQYVLAIRRFPECRCPVFRMRCTETTRAKAVLGA
jgi:hypothetical protein